MKKDSKCSLFVLYITSILVISILLLGGASLLNLIIQPDNHSNTSRSSTSIGHSEYSALSISTTLTSSTPSTSTTSTLSATSLISDLNNSDETSRPVTNLQRPRNFININNNYNNNARSSSRARNQATQWPMLKNSNDRQGASNSSLPTTPSVLWMNHTAPTYASPIVAYNRIYMATGNGYIYCFEETTGKLRWKATLTSKENAAVSTPAINSGHLIAFSSGDGKVYRINAYNGDIVWSYTLSEDTATLNLTYIDHPILIHNGYVLFGAPNRYFYCLRETTGELVWKFKTQEGLTNDYGIAGGAAAVGNDIYFGANDGYLYAMDLNGLTDGNQGWSLEDQTDAKDGDVIWKYFAGDSICSTPVVYNNNIYITVGNHNSTSGFFNIYKIFCLDRINKSIIWDYKTTDHIVSSPAVTGNWVYFGCLDGNIYCLAANSNTSRWLPFSTGDPIWSSPAVASGKMVIGSFNSKVYCLYSNNGGIDWVKELDGPVTSSPAIANNRVIINSKHGTLYSIGPADQTPPTIKNTLPMQNALDVPVSSYIEIQFNEPLGLQSIDMSNILILNNNFEPIAADVEYIDTTFTLIIKPRNYLNRSENYTITILSGITDRAGNHMNQYSWSFTTSNNNPPELTRAKVTPNIGNFGTTFTFSVLYTDKDDDPPGNAEEKILIYIDDDQIGQLLELNDTIDNKLTYLYNHNYTDGEEYVFKTNLNTLGRHNFRIWCSDGMDWNETIVTSGPILPGPPAIKPIPDIYLQEDQKYVLNLTGYLSDPDTILDQLVIQVNSSYALVNGNLITFTYPNSFNYPSGRKFEWVNISVTDNEYYASTQLKIWVEPMNDPPTTSPIPNQIVVEYQNTNISLKDYIIDIDDPFEDLNITEDSIYAEIIGQYIILNYPSGITNEIIHLNVSDNKSWVKTVINVKVVSSEVSFVIRDIPTVNIIENIELTIDMTDYLIIIKGSSLNLKLNCSSQYSYVNGLRLTFLYTDTFNYPDLRLFEDVEISVTDITVDYSQSTIVRLNVTPMNDAPTLINGTVTPEYGNTSVSYTYSVLYYDIDGSENIKINLVLNGVYYELKKISGIKTEYPGAEYALIVNMNIGHHYYYFICDDGSGSPNSQSNSVLKKLIVTGNLDAKFKKYSENCSNITDELDLDCDGILDSWELLYNLDPTNNSDALEDMDGDNFNNLLEYLGYDGIMGGNDSTDPTNASDKPRIISDNPVKTRDSIEQWQIILIGLVVIIVLIILIYFIFFSREVGRPVRAGSKTNGKSGEETDEFEMEDDEFGFEDDLIEYVDVDEAMDMDMDKDMDVPVTEVDMSDDDKPFLESDTFLEEAEKEEPPEEVEEAEEAEKIEKTEETDKTDKTDKTEKTEINKEPKKTRETIEPKDNPDDKKNKENDKPKDNLDDESEDKPNDIKSAPDTKK